MTILKRIFPGMQEADAPVDIAAIKTALEFGHNQYKQFKRGLDIATALESLLNASKDTESRLVELTSRKEELVASINDALKKAELARCEAADIRMLANTDAAAIIAEAHASATKQASDILEAANNEVLSIKAEIAALATEKAGLLEANALLIESNAKLSEHIESIKRSLGM